MNDGYIDFEFDLPGALLASLIEAFDSVSAVPLIPSRLEKVPEAQGVYQLFLRTDSEPKLVYVGKTDAKAGLRRRLTRHAKKIQQRQNIQTDDVMFKAVRVYVFTAVDLESQLIENYGGTKMVPWNGSGFGSNDPGRERDTTFYKPEHFETQYPIDIDREVEFEIPVNGTAADILRRLKSQLPYLIRFELERKNSLRGHVDLENTIVSLEGINRISALSVIKRIVQELPAGWHATKLPSHIIIYKNDSRKFPSGQVIGKSPEQ